MEDNHRDPTPISIPGALEKAREALRPLADAVFNDNGDMTVSAPSLTPEQCIAAYFAVKRIDAADKDSPSSSWGGRMTIEEYVDGYCWRGDEGDYTPNEQEKAMLIDALHGADGEVDIGAGQSGLMRVALQQIIDMNVQYAVDRYGDAAQAETMACVQVARAALSSTMEGA